MEKEYDIVAMGELLIDFTPAGVSETGMCLYERNPGGAYNDHRSWGWFD